MTELGFLILLGIFLGFLCGICHECADTDPEDLYEPTDNTNNNKYKGGHYAKNK